MLGFYPRLSKDKRLFMSEVLRGISQADYLSAVHRASLLRIANLLCDYQIEVKREISDSECPEYRVKSSNE